MVSAFVFKKKRVGLRIGNPEGSGFLLRQNQTFLWTSGASNFASLTLGFIPCDMGTMSTTASVDGHH